MKTRKIDTKSKIKNSAIKLFNTQETLSITTNHIAKEAAISPGNLYYHFKNKEEIIISIYSDLSQKFEDINSFENIVQSTNPLAALHNTFDQLTDIFYEYRFLLRDSMVLIALYPSFKTNFSINQTKRIAQIERLLRFLISENILKFEDENLTKRAKLNWFITAYWQSFASSTTQVSKESIKEAKEIFFDFMIYPFLTHKGKELLTHLNLK